MKKVSILITLFMIFSCNKPEENEVLNSNPHNLENLGLNSANNIYPNWPSTWSAGLGDNQWYDSVSGDILTISRRDQVTDDSGDWLFYTFQLKDGWIYPLNVKRVSYDAHIIPARFAQTMFNKPIEIFRIQKYTINEVLACEIQTTNGVYELNQTLIDRMWINLND